MIHVVCPACGSVNRVPHDRNAVEGKCGRCGERLFTGHPLVLTEANFDRYVARNDLPLVVDFWAPWCGPCRMMAPVFEKAAAELEPEVQLGKVNTEAEQGLAARFGIRSIPTLVAFKGGREVNRVAGAMDFASLVNWIRHHS